MQNYTINMSDICELTGWSRTTLWRHLSKPYPINFVLKPSASCEAAKIKHYCFVDIFARLRESGKLTTSQINALIEIDAQRCNK